MKSTNVLKNIDSMDARKSCQQSIEELSLMLMYLTRTTDNNEFQRYRELSSKGYNFDILNQFEQEGLIYQPRSRHGYDKSLYLTEEGRKKAQTLLKEYALSDKDLNMRFEFRSILPEEADQAAAIEKICFPPNEACSEKIMKERIAVAPDLFLVAIDHHTGKIVGFLNGLSTKEYVFRDEFFTDAGLHNPEGENIMILGLDVLPEYRGQGLAREIMFQYLRRESEKGRRQIFLTCLKSKVKMYEKMGFCSRGIANSSWGGEQWYEMSCTLNG